MYEIYPQNSDVVLSPSQEVITQIEEAESRAQDAAKLASEIGLPGIAHQDIQKVETLRALQWCKDHELAPLSEEDYGVWQDFLPSGYVNNRKISFGSWHGEWEKYAYFEGVPLYVRKLIRDTKDVFTTLEIRTPEKRPQGLPDPALFGHVVTGNTVKTFLLARWAESDANFLTFEDVKAVVGIRKARSAVNADHIFFSVILFVFAIGFWILTSCFTGGVCGKENDPILVAPFLVFAVLFTGVGGRMLLRQLKHVRAGSTKRHPELARFV